MIGTRVKDPENYLPDGGYALRDGLWMARTPNGHHCNLSWHDVTEHADGSISVSPSILVSTTVNGSPAAIVVWHGYLSHGVWREC